MSRLKSGHDDWRLWRRRAGSMSVPLILHALLFGEYGCSRRGSTSNEDGDGRPMVRESAMLEATPPTTDVGTVAPYTSCPLQFTLRNAKSITLEGIVVESSCGCIAVDQGGFDLMPGESRVVEVKLVAPSAVGVFRKEVRIHAAGRSVATVGFRGRVVTSPKLVAVPDRLDLGRIQVGEKRTFEVRLKRQDGGAVDFLEAEPERPGITVVAVDEEDADSCKVKLQLDSSALPLGSVVSKVELRSTREPPFSRAVINVRCEVCEETYGLRRLLIAQVTPGGTARLPLFSDNGEDRKTRRPVIEGVSLEDEAGGRFPKIHTEHTGEEVTIVVDKSHLCPRLLAGVMMIKLQGESGQTTTARVPTRVVVVSHVAHASEWCSLQLHSCAPDTCQLRLVPTDFTPPPGATACLSSSAVRLASEIPGKWNQDRQIRILRPRGE